MKSIFLFIICFATQSSYGLIWYSTVHPRTLTQLFTSTTHLSRKLHKNKYADFSKNEKDPLNRLIETQQNTEKKKPTPDKLRGTTVPISPLQIKRRVKSTHKNNTTTSNNIDIKSTVSKMTINEDSTDAVIFKDIHKIQPSDPYTFGYTEIGTIVKTHGVKGEIKLQITSDDLNNLNIKDNSIVYIKKPNRKTPRPIKIITVRKQVDNIYLIQFDHIKSRELAETFRGYLVYIRIADRPDLHTDEYMIRDLIGLSVYTIHTKTLTTTATTTTTTTTTTTNNNDNNININNNAPNTNNISNSIDSGDDTNKPVKRLSLKDRLKQRTASVTSSSSFTSSSSSSSSSVINNPHKQAEDYTIMINTEDYKDDIPIGHVEGVVPPDELCTPEIAKLMHSLIEIRIHMNHKELCLIPLVPSIVKYVNIKEKIMIIDPPAGLLDLRYEEKKKYIIRGYISAVAESVSEELRKELMISTVFIAQLPPLVPE